MGRKLFRTALASGVCALALAGATLAEARDFRIPAGDLQTALDVYIKQSGVQLIYRPDDVRGARTHGAAGSMQDGDALSRLLQGTGLKAQRHASGAVALVGAEPGPQGDAASEPDLPAEAAEQNTVEEVIVRATKRDESIMQVPVSMTAVTANDIERIGAKSLEDLARSVPGVVIRPGGEQGDKGFIIRGVSSASRSSTVAVYIDDTPITFGSSTPDLKLFDVSQVEFLRGPQGTLFGSSSMGGAIRYASQQPSFAGTSGFVKIEGALIQDGSQDYEIQGAVGGPIVEDRLAFRASAFARHDGGYLELRDEDTGKVLKDNINTMESYGGRVAFKALLGEGFDATLSAIYQQQNSNYLNTFFSVRGMDVVTPMQDSRVDRTDSWRDDKTFLPNLTVNYDLGFAKLTSSTSYVRREYAFSSDFSFFLQRALGLPDEIGGARYGRDFYAQDLETNTFESVVEEIRLVSQGDGPFQWILGGYYQDSDENSTFYVPTNLGVVEPAFASLLLPRGSVYSRDISIGRKQKALFGEVSYTLADRLKLTAGVRLTEMELTLRRAGDGLLNGGPNVDQGSSKEQPVTPKFSAQYTFSPNAMVYATAAKGFREGGPNTTVADLPACQVALAVLGLTQAPSTYDTDTVWSYELGAKLQTADRRFRFVGSVYRIDWEGIQQTISLGDDCGFSFIGNLGKARSQGFEAETSWRPTDALRFDASLGYTDAHLTEDLVLGADPVTGPILAAAEGTQLADVPRWTGMLAAQYTFNPVADWDAYLRGELQYVGKSHRHLNTPGDDPRDLEASDYTLINLRLGAARGPYEVSLFVNNLFDDDTETYKTHIGFAPGSNSEGYEAQRNRPRTIGASLKRRF
jgi:iron complex outermembrane receptor protein